MAATPQPLPATTPAAFKTYLNANFEGDGQKKGAPVAALNEPGATLGDQWLSFYATAHGKDGSTYTLLQYEEAFVVLWEDATLGANIAAATTQGLGTAGNFAIQGASGAASAGQAFYSLLTGGSFWIRVFEGALGVALVVIAVAKLASGTPAGKAAMRVGKAAAIL